MEYLNHEDGGGDFPSFDCFDYDEFGPGTQAPTYDLNSLSQTLTSSAGFRAFSTEVPLQDSFLALGEEPGFMNPLIGNASTTAGPSTGNLAITPKVPVPIFGRSNETVCLEDFPGDFNFEVNPATGENYTGSKLQYNYETRKLFCIKGTHEFHVKIDFRSILNHHDYKIRACVVFTDPEHRDTAVNRCYACIAEETKKTPERSGYASYFLRAPKEDHYAEYWKSDTTGRFYVSFPLKTPEPGSDYLVHNFNFACLSSCRDPGINRRTISLIFTLLNKKDEVKGRSVIGLRVCSIPMRDFKGRSAKSNVKQTRTDTAGRVKKMFSKPMEKHRQPHKTVTLPAVGEESQMVSAIPSKREVNEFELDIPSSPSSQEQSSSQETVYTDENISGQTQLRLKKLIRDSRTVFKMQKSNQPLEGLWTRQLFWTLKTAQDMCDLYKKNQRERKSLGKNAAE